MRVAIFHTTLPEAGRKPGGVEMVVHRLAGALIRYCGIDVTVFGCTDPVPEAPYSHVRLFPGQNYATNKLKRLFVLPAALNMVDFGGFDVLHLQGDDWFFVARKVPTVRTFNGSALREAQSATRLKRKISQYVVFPLEMLSRGLATRSLGIGPDATRIYRAHAMIDAGVDTAVFRPRPKAEYPLLFYVGTWNGRKRGRFAYETFVDYVLPRVPAAKLFMACDFVPRHERVVDGRFPDDETFARRLAEAWIFMYPSTYEGFGVPYIEALASGTAVVATPSGGAEYVLQDGQFGMIGTDADFGPAVVDLLQRPERRTALAAAGLARAQDFTWERVARQHERVYRELLSKE